MSASYPQIDHIIFGAPTLAWGNRMIENKLGVRPVAGGQHPGYGTHNSLLKIADQTYLEVIAPDPEQAAIQPPLWMGLHEIEQPKLIWWAAKAPLPQAAQQAARAGWELGAVAKGSRVAPDGRRLHWQLTDPFRLQEDGIVPFLIDWGAQFHPTDSLADSSCRLVHFRLLHPEPDRITAYLSAVDLEIPINRGTEPTMRVGIEGPAGLVFI